MKFDVCRDRKSNAISQEGKTFICSASYTWNFMNRPNSADYVRGLVDDTVLFVYVYGALVVKSAHSLN